MKEKRKTTKRSVIPVILLVLLILAAAGFTAFAFGVIPALPIPQQKDASPVPAFIGQEAAPKPIDAPEIPNNPYMSPGSWSGIHNDAYMSDAYQVSGPLGRSPVVSSSFLGLNKKNPLGLVVGMAFDRSGKITALSDRKSVV